MPEPLKSKLIDTIESEEDNTIIKYQGRDYFAKIARHNDNVIKYCYK